MKCLSTPKNSIPRTVKNFAGNILFPYGFETENIFSRERLRCLSGLFVWFLHLARIQRFHGPRKVVFKIPELKYVKEMRSFTKLREMHVHLSYYLGGNEKENLLKSNANKMYESRQIAQICRLKLEIYGDKKHKNSLWKLIP